MNGAPARTASIGPQDVDAAWLRTNLDWAAPDGARVTFDNISLTGGLMGTVYRVTCEGRSFVLKCTPDRRSGGWEAFVEDAGLLQREVAAYQVLDLRDDRRPVVPRCYWSSTATDGRGALALEDLGVQADAGRIMARGLRLDESRAAVEALAAVHARTTGLGDEVQAPFPWLLTSASSDLTAAVRMGIEDLTLATARWPASPSSAALAALASVSFPVVLREGCAGASRSAICHGDAWASNVVFDRRPASPVQALLVDWQFAMWGNPMFDVALLLVSSLTPSDRRRWTDDLLVAYHRSLVAESGQASIRACRDDLERAIPAASAIALATTDAYTRGFDDDDLRRFVERVDVALYDLLQWWRATGRRIGRG